MGRNDQPANGIDTGLSNGARIAGSKLKVITNLTVDLADVIVVEATEGQAVVDERTPASGFG
jgi:hypothetical protein